MNNRLLFRVFYPLGVAAPRKFKLGIEALIKAHGTEDTEIPNARGGDCHAVYATLPKREVAIRAALAIRSMAVEKAPEVAEQLRFFLNADEMRLGSCEQGSDVTFSNTFEGLVAFKDEG